MTERESTRRSQLENGNEDASPEPEARPLLLHEVSAALRVALEQAQPGETGMRTVRAIGPEGQRYTAGLHDGQVYLLELPWPNPRNQCRTLSEEPRGLNWQPHQSFKPGG